MSGGVFICYRREESAFAARAIHDRIVQQLDRENVFLDVDSIGLGVDWLNVLTERVGACDALVAVIGRNWVSWVDRDNRRRIDDPEDFVRIEIEAALKRNVPVIPVLVDGAVMPSAGELPDSLKGLARRQGTEISTVQFEGDVEKLLHALVSFVQARRRRDTVENETGGSERLADEERELQASGARTSAKVQEARRVWWETVLAACRRLTTEAVVIGDNITEDLLSEVRNIAKIPLQEDIIAVDKYKSSCTVFGLRGIYWKNLAMTRNYWANILIGPGNWKNIISKAEYIYWSRLKGMNVRPNAILNCVELEDLFLNLTIDGRNIGNGQLTDLLQFLESHPALPSPETIKEWTKTKG